jgi:TetR/AcrR family transcriptional repressor of nem operon
MSKGEKTREVILGRAAELFNVQGYSGSTLADIMQATGLHKGGIYNHFESKENLALEAFDYAFGRVKERMAEILKEKRAPLDRLYGIIRFFEDYHENPPIKGGCIILNTAIDSDDSHPQLRQRARDAMDEWRVLIQRTVAKGIAQGVMRADLNPDEVATLVIGTLEGALMMTKLYDDHVHTKRAVAHLLDYVEFRVKA